MPERPTVKLVGYDGNAFYILGKVSRALREAGYDTEYVKKFKDEAMSGDYNNLLGVCCEYVDVE